MLLKKKTNMVVKRISEHYRKCKKFFIHFSYLLPISVKFHRSENLSARAVISEVTECKFGGGKSERKLEADKSAVSDCNMR